MLPQPPLEQQQQVGDRVALVGGAQVHLHLGEERNLEAGSDQQLEVANSCGVSFDSRTRARCCRPSAAVTFSAGAGCAGVPGKCFIVVKIIVIIMVVLMVTLAAMAMFGLCSVEAAPSRPLTRRRMLPTNYTG